MLLWNIRGNSPGMVRKFMVVILDLDPWARISCAGFLFISCDRQTCSKESPRGIRSFLCIMAAREHLSSSFLACLQLGELGSTGLRSWQTPVLAVSGRKSGRWVTDIFQIHKSSSKKLVHAHVTSWHLPSSAGYFLFTWALKQSPPKNRTGWFFTRWSAECLVYGCKS